MNSKELNELIKSSEIDIDMLKPIPYVGWFWKDVDFDRPIKIAVIPSVDMRQPSPYIGIAFDNLWGYPEYTLSAEESFKFKQLIEDYIGYASYTNIEKMKRFLKETLHIRGDIADACDVWRMNKKLT